MIMDALLKSRRCRECGEGLIRPLARDGRTAIHSSGVTLPLPASLLIPTCSDCGSQWIDGPTAKALDDALGDAYLEHLKAENVRLIRQIGERYRELTATLQGFNEKWRRQREAKS